VQYDLIRVMDVIKQHLGGSPQLGILGISVRLLLWVHFFENVFSPKDWQQNSKTC